MITEAYMCYIIFGRKPVHGRDRSSLHTKSIVPLCIPKSYSVALLDP
jgi:hypothetical protein